MSNKELTYSPISQAVKTCVSTKATSKLAAGVIALGLALSVVTPVSADTFTVTNTNDTGPGSFRETIEQANNNPGHDTINFSSVSGDILITTTGLRIYDSVDINGPGADKLRINSFDFGVINNFYKGTDLSVSISDLTIVPSLYLNSGYRPQNNVSLNLNNIKTPHLGIYGGVVGISNCTISGLNSPFANGLSITGDAYVTVDSSLISDSSTGIFVDGNSYVGTGHLVLRDSEVSNNGTGIHTSQLQQYISTDLSRAEIVRSTLSGNDVAGKFYAGSLMSITESSVNNNLKGLTGDGNISLIKSTLSNNNGDALRITANQDHKSVLKILKSTISHNAGGGVVLDPSVRLATGDEVGLFNSTVSQNNGAGFSHSGSTTLRISESTITGNGGGVINSPSYDGINDPDIKIENSIIANNQLNGVYDIGGQRKPVVSHSLIKFIGPVGFQDVLPGSNLLNLDPMLAVLDNNGGLTKTHALLQGSPAIDAIDKSNCGTTDQRDVDRPQGTSCDMGAYEFNSSNNSTGVIGDYAWVDDNGNGIQDVGETGYQGLSIQLQTCSGALLNTVNSDAEGAYRFDGLAAGEYRLKFILPDSFVFSSEQTTSNDRIDSNANVHTGLTPCYSLTNDQKMLDVDVGIIPVIPIGKGVMGDFVWSDLNGDGVLGPGNERGIADVKVELQTCNGNTLDVVTTGAHGGYTFKDLVAGRYQMKFHLPGGYKFSPEKQGSSYQFDSNVNPSTGITKCYSMENDQQRLAIDAGMIPDLGSIPSLNFHVSVDGKLAKKPGPELPVCRYLVKDFGTSQSPKSTRLRDSHCCPGRPASMPLRHPLRKLVAGYVAFPQMA